MEVGHSVRTLADCAATMDGDARCTTSLLEHRLIRGARPLYADFRRMLAESMDVRAFYEAKLLEQQQRHLKHHDTAYNLEPNIKESPGGLRDLQTVTWIARAAGLGHTWRELAKAGLILPGEARTVARHERFIAGLRIRLHYLAGRREDRLVFDQQNALAREIAIEDTAARRASEQLMQRYYRAAKLVRQVNVIVLQNLHARLFPSTALPVPLDGRLPGRRRAARRARRGPVRAAPGGDARRVPDAAASPRAQGHVGAHAARAVAQPRARRRAVPARPGEPRALPPGVPRAARDHPRPAPDEPVRRSSAATCRCSAASSGRCSTTCSTSTRSTSTS